MKLWLTYETPFLPNHASFCPVLSLSSTKSSVSLRSQRGDDDIIAVFDNFLQQNPLRTYFKDLSKFCLSTGGLYTSLSVG